jgi:hypothetical protein
VCAACKAVSAWARLEARVEAGGQLLQQLYLVGPPLAGRGPCGREHKAPLPAAKARHIHKRAVAQFGQHFGRGTQQRAQPQAARDERPPGFEVPPAGGRYVVGNAVRAQHGGQVPGYRLPVKNNVEVVGGGVYHGQVKARQV